MPKWIQCRWAKEHLFTPEGVEIFRKEVAQLIAAKKKLNTPNLAQVKQRMAEVEKELTNIMNAIKAGIISKTTKAELQKAEAEKAELARKLNVNTQKLDKVTTMLPRILDEYKETVASLEVVTQPQVNKLRHKIGALVGGSISLHPEEGKDTLYAEVSGDYLGLMQLIDFNSKISLVAGAGFELTTFRL